MTNATATRTAPAATPVQDDKGAALAAAVAAVSAGSDATGAATAQLLSLTLTAYATAVATTPGATGSRDDGHVVLFDNARSFIASTVYALATGSLALPSAKDRSKGEATLGQYVSRMARVATDLTDGGVGALSDVDTFNAAHDLIAEKAAATKESAADRAFTVWLSGLNEADAKAITRTIALMGADTADDHRAAFIRAVKPVK